MFEFGRDLRKLFDKARESEDLGWLELIGANLVASEARREAIDAGRVSCARPFDAWLRASTLWREHARRTGSLDSLDHAVACASDAARHAATQDQTAAVTIESCAIHLLRFDLFGGPQELEVALSDLLGLPAERTTTRAMAAAVHARLMARRATLSGEASHLLDASALLDATLHEARSLPPVLVDELRLDRAGLSLEAGVSRRDARLLDQAGRDLRALVESASPDYRPLTRARALALAGAGMAALAALASDDAALAQGRGLFEAAADQFTPDHSPLDWVAVQLARPDQDTPLLTLAEAEGLSAEPGLVLGALVRERRMTAEASLAETMGDVQAIAGLEANIRHRLENRLKVQPLAWAADQIGMAQAACARARLTGAAPGSVGMILCEAIETAREMGVPSLARRAERVFPALAGV